MREGIIDLRVVKCFHDLTESEAERMHHIVLLLLDFLIQADISSRSDGFVSLFSLGLNSLLLEEHLAHPSIQEGSRL